METTDLEETRVQEVETGDPRDTRVVPTENTEEESPQRRKGEGVGVRGRGRRSPRGNNRGTDTGRERRG